MNGEDFGDLAQYMNTGNDLEWSDYGNTNPMFTAAGQGIVPPVPQQAQPAAQAVPLTPNTVYSYRHDVGWFVKANFPTYHWALDNDGSMFYYHPVPGPPAALQQPYQQPMSAGFNGGFAADYPTMNTPPNLPQFVPAALSSPYVAQMPPPMLDSGASTPADTPQRMPARSNRRPAFHRRSIIKKCTCRDEHIRRPPNAFIFFRSQATYPPEINALMTTEESIRMKGELKLTIEQASRLWHALPEHLKAPYIVEQERAKAQHMAKYPGYKYSPQGNLTRDFGDENCRCGAYQINMDTRRQRAMESQGANSDATGVQAPPKPSRSRRRGKRAVVRDEPQSYTSPPGVAPMSMSNAEMANARTPFNTTMNPSHKRRASVSADALPITSSKRPARGANRQVNYAEPQNYEEEEIATRIQGFLNGKAMNIELDNVAGTFDNSLFIQDDTPPQYAPMPGPPVAARRPSRPLSRDFQQQPLGNPYPHGPNFALPSRSNNLILPRRPSQHRPASARRASHNQHRQSISMMAPAPPAPVQSPARARQSDEIFDMLNEDAAYGDEDGDLLSLFGDSGDADLYAAEERVGHEDYLQERGRTGRRARLMSLRRRSNVLRGLALPPQRPGR